MRKIYLSESQLKRIAEERDINLTDDKLSEMLEAEPQEKTDNEKKNKESLSNAMAGIDSNDPLAILHDFWFGNSWTDCDDRQYKEMIALSKDNGIVSQGVYEDVFKYGGKRWTRKEVAKTAKKQLQKKVNPDYIANNDKYKDRANIQRGISNAAVKDDTGHSFNLDIEDYINNMKNPIETYKEINTAYLKYKLDVRDTYIERVMKAFGTKGESFFLNKKQDLSFSSIVANCEEVAGRLGQKITRSKEDIAGIEFDIMTLVNTTNPAQVASFIKYFTANFSKNTNAINRVNSIYKAKANYRFNIMLITNSTPKPCVPMHHNDEKQRNMLLKLFGEINGCNAANAAPMVDNNNVYINGFVLTITPEKAKTETAPKNKDVKKKAVKKA